MYCVVAADLSIPRSEANRTSFSNVLSTREPLVQGSYDPSVLGLVPIGSKPTSVIVTNQSLMADACAGSSANVQHSSSVTETLAEQTINAAGNRCVLCQE